MIKTNLGLSEQQRRTSINVLNGAIASASILLIKIKKFHWDVVGPQFMTLHKLFDEHYETVAAYVDEIAERTRMLGGVPLGTAAGFLESSIVKEHPGEVANATHAVTTLLCDHELIVVALRAGIRLCTEDAGTADFLTKLLQGHEKSAWMLRSFLEGQSVKSDGAFEPRAVPHLA
jgi:starvation-inducible DNA-binding protein